MASVAAVSANSERPDLPHNLDDDAPITGEIVAADNDGEDEEDAVRATRKKTGLDAELFDNDADQMPSGENEEDLFGEDEEDEQPKYVGNTSLSHLKERF